MKNIISLLLVAAFLLGCSVKSPQENLQAKEISDSSRERGQFLAYEHSIALDTDEAFGKDRSGSVLAGQNTRPA